MATFYQDIASATFSLRPSPTMPDASPSKLQSPSAWGFLLILLLFVLSAIDALSIIICTGPILFASFVLSIVALFKGETIGGLLLLFCVLGFGFLACVGVVAVGMA